MIKNDHATRRRLQEQLMLNLFAPLKCVPEGRCTRVAFPATSRAHTRAAVTTPLLEMLYKCIDTHAHTYGAMRFASRLCSACAQTLQSELKIKSSNTRAGSSEFNGRTIREKESVRAEAAAASRQ